MREEEHQHRVWLEVGGSEEGNSDCSVPECENWRNNRTTLQLLLLALGSQTRPDSGRCGTVRCIRPTRRRSLDSAAQEVPERVRVGRCEQCAHNQNILGGVQPAARRETQCGETAERTQSQCQVRRTQRGANARRHGEDRHIQPLLRRQAQRHSRRQLHGQSEVQVGCQAQEGRGQPAQVQELGTTLPQIQEDVRGSWGCAKNCSRTSSIKENSLIHNLEF